MSATDETEATTPTGDGQVYADIVLLLRETLSSDELGAIVGVHGRQIQNWAAGRNRPKGDNRDQLLEVHYLIERLRDVYRPEGIDIWIHGRNRDLDGQRPIDLLRDGEYRRVLAAVERLTAGIPT